ncbi:MAG TPA: glycosyltransferase family 2 protein, partial [Caulobacteraceae bacterium]|nr:glycosyltransferase family 2 protein [Caulobacteraceae bacterium]
RPGEPIVTVVISPREGHFIAERSLLSVLADDRIPFDLIYVDFAAPPKTRAAIERHAASRNFRVVHHEGWTAPSAARKSVLGEIKTRYVAFVDNDTLVEPGCLEKLVICAEETGAGLVCPIYLQAGDGRTPTIHMAGGMFAWASPPAHGLIDEGHRLQGEPLERAAGLTREKVGYPEYHYVLGRMELLSRPGAISDDVLLVHEHLDLALFAREQGMDVVLEPAARVTYVAFEPRPLSDMAFFRRRWDVEACDRSLSAFARKWPIADRAGVIDPMVGYGAARLREVELRRPGSAGTDLDQPMTREDLAQSRYSLREQAIGRGYGDDDVRGLERACDLATIMFDGVYRPDGRPFLCHVIGTASALVRYELQTAIVQSGLLHAAYTHRPAWMSEAELSGLLGELLGGDRLIVAQPLARAFLTQPETDCGSLNIVGAATVVMLAANDVDMRLSGEYRATGRPADLNPVMLNRVGEVLGHFGLDGLTRSAGQPTVGAEVWPLLGAGVQQVSFRLDAANRRMLPV